MDENAQIIHQIIGACKQLHQRGYLAACDGNVSYRLNDETIFFTPSGKHKGFLVPEDIAIITIDNEIISGSPSSERLMHLEVYKTCAKARSVVHAHPPTAIAWSVARPELKELPNDCLSEVILAVGCIPIAPYAKPGTVDMGKALSAYLPENRVLIMARHGAISWGEELQEAYNGMERLEHSAVILKSAHELGGLNPLPRKEVEELLLLRSRLGERSL